MNTYLVIITTVLVATQIVRLIQNAVQLHKQDILFKEQLGHLAECNPTEQDFENQRKAYRLIVEYFETRKIKPPIIQEVKRDIVNVSAEAELDDMYTDRLEQKLKDELVEELWKYAKVETTKDPVNFRVRGKAVASVLNKVVD